jgi:hypothetical protein
MEATHLIIIVLSINLLTFVLLNIFALKNNLKIIALSQKVIEENKKINLIIEEQTEAHKKLYIQYILFSIAKAGEEENYEHCAELKKNSR